MTARARMRANIGRIGDDLRSLARFGEAGPNAVTRIAYTNEDNAAHKFVEGLMRGTGLTTRFDAFGNLFGRRSGSSADELPIMTGSHLDGPPMGGWFDGTVGVVAGIEAVRILEENRASLASPVEVVAVRCEHLDRFGLSCLGSRALSGKLQAADLDTLSDQNGVSLAEALKASGFSPELLATATLAGRIKAWVELHIEQGRVLEDRGMMIGIVTGIAGPTRHVIDIGGVADHSGGTPMGFRRDALAGAAQMILDLEDLAGVTDQCVGTVGVIDAQPGAVHTIPGRVRIWTDIRGTDATEKRDLVERFMALVQERAESRGLTLGIRELVNEEPVPCSPAVVELLRQACSELQFDYVAMASGGGHDTQHIAAVAPAGMLFVPSAGGISHTPDEYTSVEDIARGAEALAQAILRLDELPVKNGRLPLAADLSSTST